jgi:hypothetical protein
MPSRITVIAMALILLVGCASSSTVRTTGPPADVKGMWTGWAQSGSNSLPVSLRLAQAGAKLNGDLSVGGRPDLSGPVEGVVQGDAVRLELKSGFGNLPDLTAKQDQIYGRVSGLALDLRRAK